METQDGKRGERTAGEGENVSLQRKTKVLDEKRWAQEKRQLALEGIHQQLPKQQSVGNLDDVACGVDSRQRTSAWVHKNSHQGFNLERLDARSLPDQELIQTREMELQHLQEQAAQMQQQMQSIKKQGKKNKKGQGDDALSTRFQAQTNQQAMAPGRSFGFGLVSE